MHEEPIGPGREGQGHSQSGPPHRVKPVDGGNPVEMRVLEKPVIWIRDGRYQAVLFDMDGVVTDTASLHARAWKELFDAFLHDVDGLDGSEFTHAEYSAYVDGRSRVDGVLTFLASRGIELDHGSPGDPPTKRTVCGLANRKDALFHDLLAAEGVTVIPESVELLRRLRAAGVPTALVTASRNADRILTEAGIDDLFDARIDGVEVERLGLPGKPDPAMFLAASTRLGVAPARAVVVEDAVAGVRAARAGGFGLVVGVDRAARPDALTEAGADLVVKDLGQLPVELSDPGCRLCAMPRDEWLLEYVGTDPAVEGTRESLLTLGNGYFATRGADPESSSDTVHYPGAYIAGVSNRLSSDVDGRSREDESAVNLPNWLPLTFRPGGGSWFEAGDADVLHQHRVLDLRRGVLLREVLIRDADGRLTRLRQRRLVSMAAPHLAALDTTLIPENWSGRLEVRTGLDAGVGNRNVAEYAGLADKHLTRIASGSGKRGTLWLAVETSQSRIRVAMSARTQVCRGPKPIRPERHLYRVADCIWQELGLLVDTGEEVTVEKTLAVYTSRDRPMSEPQQAAGQELAAAGDFDALLAAHEAAWHQLWQRFHLSLADGVDARLAANIHLFHLLQTLSPHTAELDAGVPARGLHGEGYRGHVFWDEIFVFPILNLRLPELTRSLLLYRYRRLPQARSLAAGMGMQGARFPWQSGSDGSEETPPSFFNPYSGRWMADNSQRQYHVGLAVAYNVWHYWETTADLGFLTAYGAELLIEIARFWASLASYDPSSDRYDIRGVMGPDEFHDGYPGRPGMGIDNNAYVNIMTAWVLARACDAHRILGQHIGPEHGDRLGVSSEELATWEHIGRRLRLSFLGNGVLSQFDGYGDLAEFDWDGYRGRYGNIGRLDLILEAEGDSTVRYQASKQADVLMLLYLFTADELTELIHGLGYDFDPSVIPAIVDYYLARTTHGSTLSRVVHAWVLARTNRQRSWQMLLEAFDADLADTQGGTTREGIHLGAMAGTLDILQRCYTGLDTRCGALWLHPELPDELAELTYAIRYRNQSITLHIDHEQVTLRSLPNAVPPIQVRVHDTSFELAPGTTRTVSH